MCIREQGNEIFVFGFFRSAFLVFDNLLKFFPVLPFGIQFQQKINNVQALFFLDLVFNAVSVFPVWR